MSHTKSHYCELVYESPFTIHVAFVYILDKKFQNIVILLIIFSSERGEKNSMIMITHEVPA